VNSAAPIYVGQLSEQVVWVRVEGKGSFQNSPELRDFANHVIAAGARRVVVDLENCPVMDSTFMGTLVGIANTLAESGGEAVGLDVINANERNVQLVKSLGLDHLFTLDTEGSSWPAVRESISAQAAACEQLDHVTLDKKSCAELMLDAHQTLSDADDGNVHRFRDVIEYLKKDLESTSA